MHLVTEMGTNTVTDRQSLASWIVSAIKQLRQPSGRVPRRHLRVVETLAIGQKKRLLLVSCDGERFLVGTSAEGVGTITRVRPEGAGGLRVEGAVR